MPFWDFFEDEILIVSAFCHIYQMRVNDFYEMSYYEFYMLLPEVLGTETAFANAIHLRRETNKERIKTYSPEQKAEWDKWQAKAKEWDRKEEARINAWREMNAEILEQKRIEIENKKMIARQRLNEMLKS